MSSQRSGKLAGKRALITGGSSGIGLATASLFVTEGCSVMVTGRSSASLDTARKTLGRHALVVASDAGDLSAIDALMEWVRSDLGTLDVLFLNAGVCTQRTVESCSEADFDQLIDVNVKGVFFTVQKALPLLNEGASVILTTSINNQMASPKYSVYAATKAAVRSLVQSLALELISRRVRVNAVSPGPIDTPMFGRVGLDDAASERRKSLIREQCPTKRFGTPLEAAKVALFLASDDSSYVVGEEIIVDGGFSLP